MTTRKEIAFQILDELHLMDVLSEMGTAQLVGSVALDLIVKPDIDMHLLLPHHDLLAASNQLNSILLEHPKVHEVRITDWRDEGGIKVGVDAYPSEIGPWSLDIWITDNVETTAFAFTTHLLAKLTPPLRETILRLKEHYYALRQLRNGLSLKIYLAVARDGVTSIEQFEAWNKHHPEINYQQLLW